MKLQVPPPVPTAASALHFGLAENADEVLDAWRLVYRVYRERGLIAANPSRLHFPGRDLSDRVAVLRARMGPVLVSTMTAWLDGPAGLPLDRVFRAQLDLLREAGRRPMVVGLFADRRRALARSGEAMIDLMRLAFWLGRATGVDLFAIAVNPKDEPFYARHCGFHRVGPVRPHPDVRGRPVSLLLLDAEAQLARSPRHPTLSYFLDTPFPAEVLDHRFDFNAEAVADSELAAWSPGAPSARAELRHTG